MIVYSIDLDLKARVGILAYWWQGAREIFRYKFPRFRMTTPGESIEASLVIVGRTKNYGGPFKITTEARLPCAVRSQEKICPSSCSAALPAKMNTSHARPTSWMESSCISRSRR